MNIDTSDFAIQHFDETEIAKQRILHGLFYQITFDCLAKAGIKTWHDLWIKTDEQILAIPGIGETDLREIKGVSVTFILNQTAKAVAMC